MDDLSLSDSYVTGGGFTDDVMNKAKSIFSTYSLWLAALMVVLVLIILYLLYNTNKEKFGGGPTSMMRYITGNQFGYEKMDSGADRSSSIFAQSMQDPTGSFTIDPNAAPGQPGSLGYQALNNKSFGCDSSKPATDDAWSWMESVAKENFVPAPRTENTFSKTLAGL